MERPDYKELLEYMLHEVTQINATIKTHAELLGQNINDKPGVKRHSELIHEHSSTLNTLIDLLSFNLNPEHFVSEKPDKRSIHGKFKKCSISYQRRLKTKNIKLRITSDKVPLIDLYPVADTLPYLIIDNAIKYSHTDGEISLEILEVGSSVLIKVENYGPVIFEEEKERLTERTFRGENAENLNVQGSGLGLSFVKHICNIHKAKLNIETGEPKYEFNGIEYGLFSLTIDIPKNYI